MRNTPYMQCRIWYLGKTAEKRVGKIGGGDRLLDSWISDETHCRVFEIASQISDNFWRRQVRKFCYSKFPISNLLHVSDFVTLVYNRFPVKRRKWISWRVEFLSYQKSYWEKVHYKSGGILREVQCDLDMAMTGKISQAVTFWKESFWAPIVGVYDMTFYPASIYYCQVPAKTRDFPTHCNAICQILYTL